MTKAEIMKLAEFEEDRAVDNYTTTTSEDHNHMPVFRAGVVKSYYVDGARFENARLLPLIEALADDLDNLQCKYEERGMAMRETGEVVRSAMQWKIDLLLKSNEKLAATLRWYADRDPEMTSEYYRSELWRAAKEALADHAERMEQLK